MKKIKKSCFAGPSSKKEDQDIKCSQCPEREACISGEPLAIPCPLEGGKQDA